MNAEAVPIPIRAAPDTEPRRLISNAFNKIHEQLSIVRSHIENLDSHEADKLMEAMDFGVLGPMRKMRLLLDIPYDWKESR